MKIAMYLPKYGVPLDDPCCYPLGFMYVSAHLVRQGHDVTVFNRNLWDEEPDFTGFDAVFMTGFEEFKEEIKRVAAICSEKKIWTHLGGALATFAPEVMAPYVNVLYYGEYDAQVPLSDVPYPDYDRFGVREYHRRNGIKHMGVLTSRGCPHNCTFCAHTCKYRCRKLSEVFAEIDHYRAKYGAEVIVFNDNTLNVNKPRFMAICNGMKERGMAWTAAIRVDVCDEEMIKAAKGSGCKYFVVGVESLQQEKLDRMNKQTTVEQTFRTLDMLHKYGIGYHGNILVGFDGETLDDIRQEVDNIPAGYNLFPAFVRPFVGTNDGRNRAVTGNQYQTLDASFKAHVIARGKYCYPDLEAA